MSKLSLRWKTPPPTIHVYYGEHLIAELTREMMGQQRLYHFRYLPEFKALSLAPLPGLSADKAEHWSPALWAFFSERIPDLRRPEIQELLRKKRINKEDEWTLLSELGTRTVTDSFELRKVA